MNKKQRLAQVMNLAQMQVTGAMGGGAVAPPAQPTGLSGSYASATQIDLTWTDNATDETAYRIYRSTDDSTYTQVGTDQAADLESYSDTTVVTVQTYYYKVAAVNAGGETLSDAATVIPTYAEILRYTYGASEVWPLTNIPSGTTIYAFITSDRNGTLVGWDLQNAAGPVTGGNAPYSDGTNDYSNIDTASLEGVFDPLLYSVFIWFKADSGTWTDGNNRYLYQLRVNNNNISSIYQTTTNNNLRFLHVAGATTTEVVATYSATSWSSAGMSVDKTGNEMKAFLNGSQNGSTQTVGGTWSGTPADNAIGAHSKSAATNPWKGHLAYFAVKFGAIWTPTDFTNMHAAVTGAQPDTNP